MYRHLYNLPKFKGAFWPTIHIKIFLKFKGVETYYLIVILVYTGDTNMVLGSRQSEMLGLMHRLTGALSYGITRGVGCSMSISTAQYMMRLLSRPLKNFILYLKISDHFNGTYLCVI